MNSNSTTPERGKGLTELEKTVLNCLKQVTGMTTCEISDLLSLNNRQVGGVMRSLSKKGRVIVYTKGVIVLPGKFHSKGAKMKLSNSYYQISNTNE